jgi:hypothetical protein
VSLISSAAPLFQNIKSPLISSLPAELSAETGALPIPPRS